VPIEPPAPGSTISPSPGTGSLPEHANPALIASPKPIHPNNVACVMTGSALSLDGRRAEDNRPAAVATVHKVKGA
jgi:hypothetical protein